MEIYGGRVLWKVLPSPALTVSHKQQDLPAATEQATKGSLSERHKERKKETWMSGTDVARLLTFHASFYEKLGLKAAGA